jgi:hypothetical protein
MVFAKGVAPAPKAVRHPMTVLPLRVGAGPLILLGSSAEAATGFVLWNGKTLNRRR